MPNADELPDAALDDALRELLTTISLEPVSPKLLELANQFQEVLNPEEMAKPD